DTLVRHHDGTGDLSRDRILRLRDRLHLEVAGGDRRDRVADLTPTCLTHGSGHHDLVQRERRLGQLDVESGGLSAGHGNCMLLRRETEHLHTNGVRTRRYVQNHELTGTVRQCPGVTLRKADLYACERA